MKTHREIKDLDGILTEIEVENKATILQKYCAVYFCILVLIYVIFS